jgi:2-polyprenyl-3-methyl-5-hydroxy-6-metoxy-1,4-benzoquinol methylase
MDVQAFDLLKKAEKGWWYYARMQIGHLLYSKVRTQNLVGKALDIGCGHGGMISLYKRHVATVDGMEIDVESRNTASIRGYTNMFTSLTDIPDSSYSVIGLFDVLEHVEDDAAMLRDVYRLLRTAGSVLLTVPANPSLWSDHDKTHHHFRRYTKVQLEKVFTEAGFEIVFCTHWNVFLYPLVAMLRKMDKAGSEGLTPPFFIDWLLKRILDVERAVLYCTPLPKGVSLALAARKK